MTMTLDTQHQRFGPSAMPFDYSSPSPSSHHPAPTFTNPWTSPSPQPGGDGTNPSGHAMYLGSHHHLGPIMAGPPRPLEQQQQQQRQQQQQQHQNQHLHHPQPQLPHQQQQSQSHQPLLPQPMPQRSNTASSTSSLASYASSMQVPVTTATGPGTTSLMATSYEPAPQQHQDLLPLPHDVLSMARLPPASAAFGDYSTSAPVSASYGSGASYDGLSFAAANTMRSIADDRKSFADALDASHGMLAMSQETPRGNAYGGGVAREVQRDSTDSYGFPNSSGTHSTSSSISSQPGGTFNSYYADSLSEYSTAGSDIESVASRSGMGPSRVSTSSSLMSAVPPPPQTMMGQFSSKLSGSTQKKHKCRVCDKRFTRPSSLQTHMYSHTGEKPFACEVEGCGRHFSVVSNLRRHKKVHRQQHDARSEAGSEDQDQDHDHPSD